MEWQFGNYCDLFVIFLSVVEEGRPEQWVEVISWEPRAFVYHNFLVSFLFFILFLV